MKDHNQNHCPVATHQENSKTASSYVLVMLIMLIFY